MAAQDHDVTIQDLTTRRTYTLKAVSSKNSKNSIDISSEAGVIGRIGPRNPRRFTWKLRPYGRNSSEAKAIWLQLDSLVGTVPVTISARTLPAGVVWALESVDPGDDNEADNAFDVDIAAMELIGYSANGNGLVDLAGNLNLQLGTIVIPPGPAEFEDGSADNPDGVTGQGDPTCDPGQQEATTQRGWLSSFIDDVADTPLPLPTSDLSSFATLGDATEFVGTLLGGIVGGAGVILEVTADVVDNIVGTAFDKQVKRCEI